jgi:hypothetical protein
MIPKHLVFWKLLFSLQNWVAKQRLKGDYYNYAQPEGGEWIYTGSTEDGQQRPAGAGYNRPRRAKGNV